LHFKVLTTKITEMKAEAQLNLLSSIPRRVPATVHDAE